MPDRRSKVGLISATMICLTVAVASGEVEAQTPDQTNPAQRVRVLKIVEENSARQPHPTSLSPKKEHTLRKVGRHNAAVAHRLIRATPLEAAIENAPPPISAEPTAELPAAAQSAVFASSSDSEHGPDLLGNTEDASFGVQSLNTGQRETAVDTEQAHIAKPTGDHSDQSIFPMLAMVSGAMLGSAVGWLMVRSEPAPNYKAF